MRPQPSICSGSSSAALPYRQQTAGIQNLLLWVSNMQSVNAINHATQVDQGTTIHTCFAQLLNSTEGKQACSIIRRLVRKGTPAVYALCHATIEAPRNAYTHARS
eukprot:GHUV01058388.1.p2 GENE.GHUV01058388.1~~GHUV01058388.1.p2  ORF type:complete len:105 (+),score=27.78 GHUV01058388.1:14-328(+)